MEEIRIDAREDERERQISCKGILASQKTLQDSVNQRLCNEHAAPAGVANVKIFEFNFDRWHQSHFLLFSVAIFKTGQ